MDNPAGLAGRSLAALINRGIAQSSSAQALATALEGRSLDVRARGTSLALRLRAAGGHVQVAAANPDTPASAALEGSPLAILGLLGGDPQARLRDGHVAISGDAEVAGQFGDLLRLARPDLEEELAQVLGDPLAHQLGRLAGALAGWGARAGQSLGRSLGEYLTEERQLLPTRVEAEEFCRQVDALANDVERAEARLARLRDQAGGSA